MKKNYSTQLEEIFRQIAREEVEQYFKTGSLNSVAPKKSPAKNFLVSIPSSKIGWIKEERKLQLFYDLLIKHGFISCPYDFFRSHFMGTESFEKINWLSNKTYLVYIFLALRESLFTASSHEPFKLLEEHFLDKDGKPLIRSSLRQLAKQVINKDPESILINIIKTLEDAK